MEKEKKDRKFGFVNRHPYDLSQASLSLGKKDAAQAAATRFVGRRPSYTIDVMPDLDVVKRIKLR